MKQASNAWALVLAGGEGTRLRALTTQSSGTAIPKQYCSLTGRRSLLEETIARASHVVPEDRICTIVAHRHREWWSDQLAHAQPQNVIVQPRNRGTVSCIHCCTFPIATRPHESCCCPPITMCAMKARFAIP